MSRQAYRARMPTYASILNSDVFNFLIGPSRTRFGIHKALLAAHSDVLKRVLDGHMREANQNEMVLADVEEECFACFSEYLYTGEYPVPRPRELFPQLSNGLADLAIEEEEYRERERGKSRSREAAAGSSRVEKKKARSGFPVPFGVGGEYSPPRPSSPMAGVNNREAYKSETHDFTSVFITLAGLYVLAEKYNIQYLKHLALSDLSNQLKFSFDLIPSRRSDIVELIRYTYNNTYEPPQDPRSPVVKEEGLRSLVSNYAALNLAGLRPRASRAGNPLPGTVGLDGEVGDTGGFDELIADGGDFIKDLLRKVAIDEDENRRYGNTLLDIPSYYEGFRGGERGTSYGAGDGEDDKSGGGMDWPF